MHAELTCPRTKSDRHDPESCPGRDYLPYDIEGNSTLGKAYVPQYIAKLYTSLTDNTRQRNLLERTRFPWWCSLGSPDSPYLSAVPHSSPGHSSGKILPHLLSMVSLLTWGSWVPS